MRSHGPRRAIATLRVGAAALALAAAMPCLADRPFLATVSAEAEEDDDRVWAVAAWHERTADRRAFTAQAEYAFDPSRSLGVSVSRARAGDASANAVELEGRLLHWRPARHGFGLGVHLAVEAERASGESWRRSAVSMVVPGMVPLLDGALRVTGNVGWVRPAGAAGRSQIAAAVDGDVARRTTLFAEIARVGDDRLVHAGVRYAIRREKVHVDAGWLRRGDDGRTQRGWVVGVAFSDL